MGRDEFRHPLKFCAPEILCPAQGITPVNGGLGADSPCQGEMARRARGGRESRHGERSSPLRRSPASYGSFSTWKRNSPRRAKPCKTRRRGHGPGQLLLPLRGNSPSAPALRGSSNDACSLKRPLIRHGFAVPPSPQGEGFLGDYPLIRPLWGHLTLSPLAFGHLPLTRGVGPQGEGEKDDGGEINITK